VARLSQHYRLHATMCCFHVRLSVSIPRDIRALEHGRQFQAEFLSVASDIFPGLQLVFIEFAEKGVQEGLEFVQVVERSFERICFNIGRVVLRITAQSYVAA
jgi:hypothetical protein